MAIISVFKILRESLSRYIMRFIKSFGVSLNLIKGDLMLFILVCSVLLIKLLKGLLEYY